MIVFDGSLPDETLHQEQANIEEFLKQNAAFEKTDVWGKRSLAYTIRRKKLGYYCLFLYEAEGAVINALEKPLKLNESVIRYLTVVRNVKNDTARGAYFAQFLQKSTVAEEAATPEQAEPEPDIDEVLEKE